jgi:hypothetical protein
MFRCFSHFLFSIVCYFSQTDIRKAIKNTTSSSGFAGKSNESFYYPTDIKLSEEELKYQEWYGNHEIPKRWKHFLSQAEQQYLYGPTISVPFKPPYWENITREGKDIVSTDTLAKDKEDKGNCQYSSSELEEVFYSLPWLNGLTISQISQLESCMTVQHYKEGETIVKVGEPLTVNIVK